MAMTGSCLCGAVRYRIEAEPVATRSCWCRTCQALGAGSATVNVFFPAEAIAVEGNLRAFTSSAESGNRVDYEFCPVCGTPVFVQSEANRALKGVRAGTLDDKGPAKPEKVLWVSEAPSWALMDPATPQEERQ
jgi:hypothetical protein